MSHLNAIMKGEESEQKRKQRARDKASLEAPFEAMVAERLVANFTTISAGTPIARLHDMSALQVPSQAYAPKWKNCSVNDLNAIWRKPIWYRVTNSKRSRMLP